MALPPTALTTLLDTASTPTAMYDVLRTHRCLSLVGLIRRGRVVDGIAQAIERQRATSAAPKWTGPTAVDTVAEALMASHDRAAAAGASRRAVPTPDRPRDLRRNIDENSPMATDPSFVEYVRGQSGLGDALTSKKMFGEYALYLHDKVVGFVCDNQLFLKPTDAGRSILGTVSEHPPYPGAKLYFRIDEQTEDRELLRAAFETTARVLPLPKPRAGKAARGAASTKVAKKTARAKS